MQASKDSNQPRDRVVTTTRLLQEFDPFVPGDHIEESMSAVDQSVSAYWIKLVRVIGSM